MQVDEPTVTKCIYSFASFQAKILALRHTAILHKRQSCDHQSKLANTQPSSERNSNPGSAASIQAANSASQPMV